MLSPILYNFFHYLMTFSYLMLSIGVPGGKMKFIGLLLTIVNYLLFLR